MKRICILLTLALLLGCLAACAGARLPDETRPAASEEASLETDPPATAPDETAFAADALPDFTVDTVTGGVYHLYDEVKTHELVLINLFATWCGPCKMEFPYLEEAWEQTRDRVSVIALSVEPTDTLDALRGFADDLGLNFPVAREDGTDLSRFVTEGIPTTLIVDRTGRVAAVEIGAKRSAQEFLDLFDGYSGESYDPALCTYAVGAYDVDTYAYVGGVVVNFCTDTACTPVVTTEDGPALFTGAPAEYHVQIVQAPDGWTAVGETEFYTEAYGQTFWLPFREAGE